MKNLLITGIFITLVISGCNSGKSSSRENPGTDQDGGVAVYLTEAGFKEKVFNFDENKEWKYEGEKPAIIDFYADWCAPCRELSPLLEEVVSEYGDKVVLYKIDTVKETELAEKLGVQALPTLLYISLEGKPQVRMGLVPKESLRQAIDEILLSRNE